VSDVEVEQLKVDFGIFRENCIILRGTHNTFFSLYGADETQQILRKAAAHFFDDLHALLIESYFLRVGRVCDPAQSRGKANLSLAYIVEQLEALDLASEEIRSLAMSITSYGKLTKNARNKAVAHNDLQASRNGGILGGHTREEIDEFLQNVNQFTDMVAKQLGLDPLDYSVQAGPGDVIDLIKLLKKATE